MWRERPSETRAVNCPVTTMTNLLQQAINCDDADRAAKIIQDALGIEADDRRQLLLPEDLAE
jgi:uncharacterized protein HemY